MKSFDEYFGFSKNIPQHKSDYLNYSVWKLNELFGTHYSPQQLALQIEDAVGGFGTNEEKFAQLVTSLRNLKELEELNNIMKSNPDKFTYSSLEEAIEGELGIFDNEWKQKILNHLKQLGKQLISTKKSVGREVSDKLLMGIKKRLIFHEGKKYSVYKDSKGIPTIGVGFNLRNRNADERLKKVGANPKLIKSGKSKLSEEQIDKLLMEDLKKSYQDVKDLVPNFESLESHVKGVLVEMNFNLGKDGLSKFKKFLKFISLKQYIKASKEMLNSDWSAQVGDRAKRLSDILQGKSVKF